MSSKETAREKRARAKAREETNRAIARQYVDPNRCHAWTANGTRCALDIGHYRSHTEPNPCPHVAEDGTEWFGSGHSCIRLSDRTNNVSNTLASKLHGL